MSSYNLNVPQPQPEQPPNNASTKKAGVALLSTANTIVSERIIMETPISSELWKVLMELLNKTNQDNKLL